MTRHDQMLAETILGIIDGASTLDAITQLFELGLISRRNCEQHAMRTDVERLAHSGTPRCEAMHATAERFSCSYEKVRGAIYNTSKS